MGSADDAELTVYLKEAFMFRAPEKKTFRASSNNNIKL